MMNYYQQPMMIPVRSEIEAQNYPIAPGVSLVFKDENAPYIYVKTMGLSQFDRPTFERYRYELDSPAPTPAPAPVSNDVLVQIQSELSDIVTRIEALEKPKRTKKEVIVDE